MQGYTEKTKSGRKGSGIRKPWSLASIKKGFEVVSLAKQEPKSTTGY